MTKKSLLEFVTLFNEERYFEAHEVLELEWRVERGEVKDFYQGLIQIAAVFVHIRKGTPDGGRKLLHSAKQYLKDYSNPYCGIDHEKLVKRSSECLSDSSPAPKILLA